jgi:mono/diheme cytochrome c family protein
MRWLGGSILLLTLGAGVGCGGKVGDPSPVEIVDVGPDLPARNPQPDRGSTVPNPTRPPRGGSTSGNPAPVPPESAPPSDVMEPAFEAARMVLETYCGGCHGAAAAQSGNVQGFGEIGDIAALITRGLVVPLESSDSRLVQVMLDGSMPPLGVGPRPTSSDIQTVIDFIDNRRFWRELESPPLVDAGPPAVVSDAGADAG